MNKGRRHFDISCFLRKRVMTPSKQGAALTVDPRDYTTRGKVKICMYEYINKMLSKLPTNMNGSAKTPAAGKLLSINPGARKLPEAATHVFHHLEAKLL